jgi:hypothetical protein
MFSALRQKAVIYAHTNASVAALASCHQTDAAEQAARRSACK